MSQSWLVANTLVTVTTSGSSSIECAVCKQKKAKQTASKAAAKLRLLKTNIEAMHDSGNRPSLFPAINTSETRANEGAIGRMQINNSKESGIKLDPRLKQKESVESVLKDGTDMASESNSELSRYPQAQSLLACDVVESLAVENPDQRKTSRVDSALEMTEDSESYKVKGITDDKRRSLERAGNNQQELEKVVLDIECSENENEKPCEISLVNRLALEQQNVGHTFSPTDYFLNKMNTGESTIPLTETEKGKNVNLCFFYAILSFLVCSVWERP